MLYWLNLIFNSNQCLGLFRQTQILRSTRHKNFQKRSNEDFLYSCLILAYISPTTNLLSPSILKKFLNSPSFKIHTLNLHFTNNKFAIPKNIEEILEYPIFLNSYTELNFIPNNPYFYGIPTKNITDKFTIIRDLRQFLQSGFTFYARFE